MTKAPPDQPVPAKQRKAKPPTQEPARSGRARQIADLMPAISETAFRKFGFVQSALLTRWPEIVGERLARVTQPESLRFARGTKADGLLRLTVTGASAPMVQHLSGDLMAAVNRFFGYHAVARVHLIQGALRRPSPARVPALAPAIASIATGASAAAVTTNASVRRIADPELRAVLEGLAASLATRDGPAKIS